MTEKPEPTWQIVALDDYNLPAAPTADAATRGAAHLWRIIRGGRPASESPEKSDEELKTFPDAQLDRLAPPIDWQPAAEALRTRLEGWLGKQRQSARIRFFIGPPFGGRAEILRLLADQQGWPVVEPPSAERILARDEDWISTLSQLEQPWVLPDLERCYLRHAEGLGLVRSFFKRAFSDTLGVGLIGCDSWAWSFLRKVWPVPPCEILTLQAFDSQRLKPFFRELAVLSGLGCLRFRESHKGKDLLPTPGPEEEASAESRFLTQLAAQSRGIPGVARMYWRSSLRAEPDDKLEDPTTSPTGEANPRRPSVWLNASLREPTLPADSGTEIAFVLHGLLLHSGLPEDLLERLLPLPNESVTSALLRLKAAGLVDRHEREWRVSALGYPVVRQFLKSNGYLVDSF
ncbi:MAG: hypothetical protein ACOWWM_06405 [Desulfobacterales bacterium]